MPQSSGKTTATRNADRLQIPLKLKLARFLKPLHIAKLTQQTSSIANTSCQQSDISSVRYLSSRVYSEKERNHNIALRNQIQNDELADRRNIVFERFAGRMAEQDAEPIEASRVRKSRLEQFRHSLGKGLAKRLPRVLVNWFRNIHRSRHRYSDRVADATTTSAADSHSFAQQINAQNSCESCSTPQRHPTRQQPPSSSPPVQVAPRSSFVFQTPTLPQCPQKTHLNKATSGNGSQTVLNSQNSKQSVPQYQSNDSPISTPSFVSRKSSNGETNFAGQVSCSSATATTSRKSSITSNDQQLAYCNNKLKPRLPRSNVINFTQVLQDENEEQQKYLEADDDGTVSMSASVSSSFSGQIQSPKVVGEEDESLLSGQASEESNESEAEFESESELRAPILSSSISYNQNLHQHAASGRFFRNELPIMAHSKSIQSQMSKIQNGNSYSIQNQTSVTNRDINNLYSDYLTQRMAPCNGSNNLRPLSNVAIGAENGPTEPLAKRLSLQFNNERQFFEDETNSRLPSFGQRQCSNNESNQWKQGYQEVKTLKDASAFGSYVTDSNNNELDFRSRVEADSYLQFHRKSIAAGETIVPCHRSVSYVTNQRMFFMGMSSYESRRNERRKRPRLASSSSTVSISSQLMKPKGSEVEQRIDTCEKRRKTIANSNSFSNSYKNAPIVKIVSASQRSSIDETAKIASPVPSVSLKQTQQQRVVIQATTTELMQCLCDYLYVKCRRLHSFKPSIAYNWLRDVDRTLLAQGWQEIAFINPANLVFLYMLLRDLISEDIESEAELQLIVMTSLYLSYSYMGNEISYPLQPFLCKQDRHDRFWDRTLYIIELMSGLMLKLNADAAFFAEVFAELKNCQSLVPRRSTEHGFAQISSIHQCSLAPPPPPPPPRRQQLSLANQHQHISVVSQRWHTETAELNNNNERNESGTRFYNNNANLTNSQQIDYRNPTLTNYSRRNNFSCSGAFEPSQLPLTENNDTENLRKVLRDTQNESHRRTYSIS